MMQRPQALKDAAALAGLNVLALVNAHSAAALQFGIERDFAAKEQKVRCSHVCVPSTECWGMLLGQRHGSAQARRQN